MEEYSNYLSVSDELDRELRECLRRLKKDPAKSNKDVMTDTTAKTLFKMRNINRGLFLSGQRKDELINKRKNVDQTLQQMYYATKF